jgi:hypothetical protein
MRVRVFLVSLWLAALTVGAVADTLVVGTFPQRMASRYTTANGLPGKRVSAVKVENNAVFLNTELGQATLIDGQWKTVESNRRVSFAKPAVPAEKLPTGVEVFDSAKTPDGRTWVVTDRGVFRSEGDSYVPFPTPTAYKVHQANVDIDAKFHCVTVDKIGHVWFGTDRGIYVTDGANWWNPIDGASGLPYTDVTCLAFSPNADLWVGTTEGVCRYTAGGKWEYYWGPRWLPNNHVNAIAVAPDGAAWVATDGGATRLYDASMTLAQKAAHYQEITDARHNRRGYVTGGSLKTPGDPNGGVRYEASDNDGLWTSVYVAAEAFRYAATKDPQARALAKKSMDAMMDLMNLTGVPGFPARAVIFKNEKDVYGYDPNETVRLPGETDKIWFPSPVDPNVLCKGDTSSDELDGHYFAYYVYNELAATTQEKKILADHIRALTDNILTHDLTLVGPTGRRTLWGEWNPKALNDDPHWWEERGINALEILAYLKIAAHLTGDPKYEAKYQELITKDHYLLNTVTEKVAGPWYRVNHSDDQMAFMMYYALMELEKDPAYRLILLQSMDRSWHIEQPEHSPFFNFVYGATTGRPCDVEESVATLQDWPWELIDWQASTAQRADVTLRSIRFEGQTKTETTTVVPICERSLMRWNGNPYETGGGSPDGRGEDDGSAWLLPYWMGRYHGFIAEKTK